jgi:hypothetical protein
MVFGVTEEILQVSSEWTQNLVTRPGKLWWFNGIFHGDLIWFNGIFHGDYRGSMNQKTGMLVDIPGLVNCYITMDNHHFIAW